MTTHGKCCNGLASKAWQHFQDIPKLPDHAASRTFFTWSVSEAAVQSKVAGEYLKAAGNIRARLDHAFRQHASAHPMLHEMLFAVKTRSVGKVPI